MRSLYDFQDPETGLFRDEETGVRYPAEQVLFEAVRMGEFAWAGRGLPSPQGDHAAIRVRASFLRYLALGGCENCRPHEKGVQLVGAWIEGPLDLEGAQLENALLLFRCWATEPVRLRGARTRALNFGGCRLTQGLDADGLRADGPVFLRSGFHASGGVILRGARIEGNFECTEGVFENPGGMALNAAGARISGSVFLRDGFASAGETSLMGAEIGGNLDAGGGRFKNPGGVAFNGDRLRLLGNAFLRQGCHASGEARLQGAEIGGQFSCVGGTFENAGGPALNLSRARIAQGLVLRGLKPDDRESENGGAPTVFDGVLDLRGARAAALEDEDAYWPKPGELRLDEFVYDRIGGKTGRTDYPGRRDWLLRQHPDDLLKDFKSQPFDQAARVLRAMGHGETGRRILALKERTRIEMLAVTPWPVRLLMRVYGALAGYGHRLELALGWALAVIVAGAVAFQLAWATGGMAPVGARAAAPEVWTACLNTARSPAHASPAACWLASEPGREHEGFSAILYSVDLFLPVIELGQTRAWAPARERGVRLRELATDDPDRTALRELRDDFPVIGEWIYRIASVRTGDMAWGWRFVQMGMGYLLSAFALAGAYLALRRE